MASKKKGARKKAPGKAVPETIGSHDKMIAALMVAGFIAGFLLYLLFIGVAPPEASTAVSIEYVQFFREQGEISFILSSQEDASTFCRATVALSSGGTQVFEQSVDAGILEPHSNRTVSIEAAIPQGKFDYDIKVSCDSVAEE